VAQLGLAGIVAHPLPFQRIETTLVQATIARQLLRQIPDFDALVFTSPNAVEAVAAITQEPQTGLAVVAAPLVYAVGPGTAAALKTHFPMLGVTLPSGGFDGDAVLKALLPGADGISPSSIKVGAKVAIVRGEQGRDDWIEQLAAAGLQIQRFAVYHAIDCLPSHQEQSRFLTRVRAGEPTGLVLSSVRNTASWQSWSEQNGLSKGQCSNLQIWAIHPNILRQLDLLGYPRTNLIAPGIESLRDALKSWS
jgi:uroporphyrinogen-III synthase